MYETFVAGSPSTKANTDATTSGGASTSIRTTSSNKSLDDSHNGTDSTKLSKRDEMLQTHIKLKCVPVAELGEVALTAAPLLQANKAKINIPVPQIDPVQDYARLLTPNYQIPKSLVRHLKPATSHQVRYTADLEDEQWIKHNQMYEGNYDYTQDTKSPNLFSTARLTVKLFEDMITILEEGTGFETIIRLDQAEKLFAANLSSSSFKPQQNKRSQAVQSTQQKSKGSSLLSSDALLEQTSLTLTNDIYEYWVSKRSKLRKPLLRKFWPTTASNDTNPHMVFRPREKEKYKLRKKRQNDMDTLRKLQLLRNDFDRVRQILEQVSRREKLLSAVVSLRHDWFDQQRYDCTNTSGLPRRSFLCVSLLSLPFSRLHKISDLDKLLEETPSYCSTTKSGKKGHKNLKRKRSAGTAAGVTPWTGGSGRSTPVPSDSGNSMTTDDGFPSGGNAASSSTSAGGEVFLGEEHGVYLTTQGDPNASAGVPNFTQPMKARQEFITSWDESVPFVESYVGGKTVSFTEFRHRGRIGRGGRICIDRIPGGTAFGKTTNGTVEYVGNPPSYFPHKSNNVMPIIMNAEEKEAKRRRIEEIAAVDEIDSSVLDDIQVELVPMKEWLDTDTQKWGEETLALGPV